MLKNNFVSVACAVLVLFAFRGYGRGAEFYVAPAGLDTNPGTIQKPFATIVRARDEVRRLIATGLKESVTVFVRGGTYTLTEAIVFGIQDSGTGQHTITYAAYQNEQPVFSAGVKIRVWARLRNPPPELPEVARSKVWVAEVPKPLGRFYSLYDSHGHLPRARGHGFTPLTPPGESNDSTSRGPDRTQMLYFPPGAMKNWSNLDDIEILIRPYPSTVNILGLEFVDVNTRVARTRLPGTWPLRALRADWGVKASAWVENVLEGLDQPGEWVLDTHSRRLYLWPRGQNPDGTIVAPCLGELIRVEGRVNVRGPLDEPVRNLIFKGLTFEHADRVVWTAADKGMQHDWEMEDKADALIRFRGAANCVVKNCRFRDSGGNAIRLDYYAQGNRIEGNEMRNLGQGGIVLFGYGPGTKDVNKANEILNNHIHHCGLLYEHSIGIVLWQSGANRVASNYVHDMPRHAVCISGARLPYFQSPSDKREVARTFRWFEIGNPSSDYDRALRFLHSRQNLIENNEVARVLQRLSDGAAINLSGAGEGNVIRHNYLHDIYGSERAQAVLRNDDWQCGSVFEENLVVGSNVLFAENKGRNDFINNIVIDMASLRYPGEYLNSQLQILDGARIERNVFFDSMGAAKFLRLRSGDSRPPRLNWNNNLYYDARPDKSPSPQFLQDMRARGFGLTDVYADPMFVDPTHGDYRFKPDSPALKLGIKPIDLRGVGLTNEFPKWLLK